MRFWKNIKSCRLFLKNCHKELIVLLIFTLIVAVMSSISPSIGGMLINHILESKFKTSILLVFLIGFLEMGIFFCNLLITKTYLVFQKKIVLGIRKKACNVVLNLKLSTIKDEGQGKFLNRIKDDSNYIATYLGYIKDSLVLVISNIGVLFVIFYLNKIIGLYYFVCTLVLLLIHFYGIKKSLYYKEENLNKLDYNASLLGQVIKGAKDIKVLKLKDNFKNKTDNSFEEIGALEYKSQMYIDYTNKLTRFLETVSTGGMLLLSVILIKNNLLLASTFIMIFMYRNRVFTFSNKMAQLINHFGKFNLSLQRIMTILDYQTEKFGNLEMKDYQGNITFKNVYFSYHDKFHLKNINFHIKAGEFVTIVGHTGSGKSTLFSLITKTDDVLKGSIFLDNYNINSLKEESIRESVSLVTQQPFIFNMSIKNNLAIIDDDFNKIKKVCALVGLSAKINSLKDGYDTIINEDAANLSGGEKQKLALARALLSNSKVILLDEVTNNLDPISKKDIEDIILKLKKDYTIIMITHDFHFNLIADKVMVLENGNLIAKGKHKKLLEENSTYKKLCRGLK